MKVTPRYVIKDAGLVCQPDREYDVPDDVGAYWVANGWADSPDAGERADAEPAEDVVADIAPDSTRHAASSKLAG